MDISETMYIWAKDLFPLHRCITGDGVRETIKYMQKLLPALEMCSVTTGYKAFDWEVPSEWGVNDAYILDPSGNKIVDINKSNLHLVAYSVPYSGYLQLEQLKEHLYTLPDQPEAIPYVTSYYKKRWGFCISHNQLKELKSGKYYIKVDSFFKKGEMNYAELYLPGSENKEILFSTYICHPSLANNELSGPVLTIALAQYVMLQKNRRLSYRFLFLPETIGSITYISKELNELQKNLLCGFVLTCVGDNRNYSYLASRYGNTLADKALLHVLNNQVGTFKKYSYLERGSDERQYCSPGVDLPICTFMRTKFGEYPEYHTSLDNLEIVSPDGLGGSYSVVAKIIEILENNLYYVGNTPCEIFLSKHNLSEGLSLKSKYSRNLWLDFLAYADGKNDLIDIANILGVCASELISYKDILMSKGLLTTVQN